MIDVSLDEHPKAIKIINNTNKTICFIQDKNKPNTFRMQFASDTLYHFDSSDDRITCLESTDWINIGNPDE